MAKRKQERKITRRQELKDEFVAEYARTLQDKQPTMCDCLQDEICDACRRASGDGPLVMCQTGKANVAAPMPSNTALQFSIVCVGCDGKKIQRRHSDGINILCPVCNGSGQMPSVPMRPLDPWPLSPWPYQHPWHQGTGVTPPPFPSQIID